MKQIIKQIISHRYWEVFTNFAFIITGGYIFFSSNEFWGLAVMFMGFSSGYGHATGDFKLDWASMFFCFSWLLLDMVLVNEMSFWMELMWSTLLGLFLPFFLSLYYEDLGAIGKRIKWLPLPLHYLILGALYLTVLGLSFTIYPWKIAALSGFLFATGFIIRQKVDHGLWHIIIAIALIILAL